MERDNKSPYSEANTNLADFSWVEPELQKIRDNYVSTEPKLAKVDYWNVEKGFGFVYVDDKGNPSERSKSGSRRVFLHLSSIEPYSYDRYQHTKPSLDQIVIGSFVEDEKGLRLTNGFTFESWQRKKDGDVRDQFIDILDRVHSQNRRLWNERVVLPTRKKILELQKPIDEGEKKLCPNCSQDVTFKAYPAGMGLVYHCGCGWNCSEQMVSKLEINDYPESDDGMRPAGSISQWARIKEINGKPPVMVPEQQNAAYKVESERAADRVLGLGGNVYQLMRHSSTLEISFDKIFCVIEEYANLIKHFSSMPDNLGADDLFDWAVKAKEKIIQDCDDCIKSKINDLDNANKK